MILTTLKTNFTILNAFNKKHEKQAGDNIKKRTKHEILVNEIRT